MAGMQQCQLIQIYLPLYDTAGEAIPASLFQEVTDVLTDRFGGLTKYTRSPAEGLWKEAEEKTVKDDILIYEVIAPDLDATFWQDYKEVLKRQFKQEELLISCASVTIV